MKDRTKSQNKTKILFPSGGRDAKIYFSSTFNVWIFFNISFGIAFKNKDGFVFLIWEDLQIYNWKTDTGTDL